MSTTSDKGKTIPQPLQEETTTTYQDALSKDDSGASDSHHHAAADAGVNVLSEEQTNAAMAALRDASTIVIGETPDETKVNSDDDNKKRKPEEEPETKPPAKRRATPVRVSWEDRMEMLRKYKEEHGDLLIPIRYKLNPSLGKFVHNTREQYKLFHKRTPEGYKKKCSLTSERIKQLDDLGFVWSTERTKRQDEDWHTRLEQLKQYKEKHGDCLVPHGYKDDPSFAEWIHRQRTTYATIMKEDKPNPMIKERMDKLTEIGFNFTVHSDKWMDHWELLKKYKEQHGHCQVPTHFAENPKLGRWVHTQRHQRRLQMKGKKSCMTQDRVDLLNQLEFSWEVRPSLERPRATWQQRYNELKEFQQEHGHFKVPAGTHPALHSWCLEQKTRLKNLDKNGGKDISKRMGPERVESLQEIGFTKDAELTNSQSEIAPAAVAAASDLKTATKSVEEESTVGVAQI